MGGLLGDAFGEGDIWVANANQGDDKGGFMGEAGKDAGRMDMMKMMWPMMMMMFAQMMGWGGGLTVMKRSTGTR